MRVDPEFEEFCRKLPGVSDVTKLSSSYCVSMQASDVNPIKRAVVRWLAARGKSFPLSWEVHQSTMPSTYDSMDRAIGSMTYIHRPEE